jgi:hypothetical protein
MIPIMCECILHESTAKLRAHLARLDSLLDSKKPSASEMQKELKRALTAQEASIKVRNMVEYAKVRALNIGDPLQTHGHTLGELKTIREPPKKKQKKGKKPALDGGVAATK